MAGGKGAYVGQAVRHLAANGVEIAERGGRNDVRRDVVHNFAETFKGLGGLGKKADVAVEVHERVQLRKLFHHDSFALRLPHKPEHLGVAALAVNHDLRPTLLFIHLANAALQLQHHGAGGINERDAPLGSGGIRGRRFAMRPKQHTRTFGQAGKAVVVNSGKPEGMEALALAAVVHDVAEAIERAAAAQFVLCLADGSRHAEAKAGGFVNFYGGKVGHDDIYINMYPILTVQNSRGR